MFTLYSYSEVNPELIVSLLGSSRISEVTVWETPVTPLAALRTLILERRGSTFNSFTVSVPIPRRSLDWRFDKSPRISICVTIPVAPSVPIATAVVPNPVTLSLVEVIPAL